VKGEERHPTENRTRNTFFLFDKIENILALNLKYLKKSISKRLPKECIRKNHIP
jgi:hypothetical protein